MRNVAIIGLGTLGSAVAKSLAETGRLDELTIIDYDVLESKNIHNSIYNASQIGELKVEALKELIGNDTTVTPVNMKYKEGTTPLPKCELVIDCRDVVCDRGKEIDVRMYITGKILIVDCRKNVKTRSYDGAYRSPLTKTELTKAGFFAADIICSKTITHLMRNKLIQRIDLDCLTSMINKELNKHVDNRVDIIYDGADQLNCLEENIKPIMAFNMQSDVDVFIGERREERRCTTLPKQSLRNYSDLIKSLSRVVMDHDTGVNFIVSVKELNGKAFIELLHETGAA